MGASPLLARLGLRTGGAGTSAALALAVGTSLVDAARIGVYGDTTAAAEKIGFVVGGVTGPTFTRSGTTVLANFGLTASQWVKTDASGNLTSAASVPGSAVGITATQIGFGDGSGFLTSNANLMYTVGTASTGYVTVSNTTASTSSTTGALVVSGGVGVAGALYVGGNLVPRGGTAAVSENTIIGAGVSVPVTQTVIVGDLAGATVGTASRDVFVGYNARATGDTDDAVVIGYNASTGSGSDGAVAIGSGASAAYAGSAALGNGATTAKANQMMLGTAANITEVNIPTTTASTSTTSGALVVAGGAGIGGKLNVGNSATINGDLQVGITEGLHYILCNANTSGACIRAQDNNLGIKRNWMDIFAGPVYGATLWGTSLTRGLGLMASSQLSGEEPPLNMFVGTSSLDIPIRIGINTSEVAQFTGGTLGTDGLQVKYTTASTSATTGALVVSGGVGVSGAINAALGSLTASTPGLALTQTWNDGSVTFKAATITVTDTASAVTSRYFDILSGSNTKFHVKQSGSIENNCNVQAGSLQVHGHNCYVVVGGTCSATDLVGSSIFLDVSTTADTPTPIGVDSYTRCTNVDAIGVYGVKGRAEGAGTAVTYGVYGTASGGATNWAGYFAGDVTITGKLTVDGLIDPTGLALTPVAANPGGALAASTLWANSTDSDKLYFGASAVGGGGGTPGGSDTQVQFNDGGAFGGSAGFTFNKTTGTVTIAAGTITASAPALAVMQTWNSGAVSFVASAIDITDTASDTGSYLALWKTDTGGGPVARLYVTKAGAQYLGSYLTLGGYMENRGQSAPSVSGSGNGRIYFDSSANKYKVSENGGAYADLVGSGSGSASKEIRFNIAGANVGYTASPTPGTFTSAGTPPTGMVVPRVDTQDYSDSADQYASWAATVPDNYAGEDLTVEIEYLLDSVTSGDVTWKAAFAASGDATDMTNKVTAAKQATTSTVPGTAQVKERTTIAFTQAQADSLAAGSTITLLVGRDTAAGTPAAAAARMTGLRVYWP